MRRRATALARRGGNSPPASRCPAGHVMVRLDTTRSSGRGAGRPCRRNRATPGTPSRWPLIASKKRFWIACVSSPGSPSGWSSISRTGTISAAVPVRKTSSAWYSSPRAMSRSTTSKPRSAAICTTDRAVMPSRIEALDGGVQIAAVAHHEHVLAGALRHVAVLVEQDRLVVSGLRALDLGEDRVEVLAAGLRLRDEAVGRHAPPGRDLAADAVLLALLAEVGAPRPDRDHDVDREVQREQAHLAVAAVGDRADVAAAQLVRAGSARASPRAASRACTGSSM